MYAKIQVTGQMEAVTGMHIGGSCAFAAIGAVDSPVVRDIRTNQPMVPGSSLKGKMRALLAKVYNEGIVKSPNEDNERLARVFGTSQKGRAKRSRILVSDMVICNEKELRGQGLIGMTEIKFENSIDRITAVANPRQVERVVRGARFSIDMVYEVSKETEIIEDFEEISQGFRLLQFDYLGGNGSRGYGKVKFQGLDAKVVIGTVSEEIVGKCRQMLEEV